VTRYDADQHVDPMIAQLRGTVKLRPPAVAGSRYDGHTERSIE